MTTPTHTLQPVTDADAKMNLAYAALILKANRDFYKRQNRPVAVRETGVAIRALMFVDGLSDNLRGKHL